MLFQRAPAAGERSTTLALLLLIAALIAVAFAPIFIRLSETELGPNATVFNRLFLFALLFGVGRAVSQRLTGQGEPPALAAPSWRQGALLLGMGLVASASLVLWAISLAHTSVAKSMLLNNLTPIFTSLGGWLVLGQRFDGRFLAGMAIALSGATALALEDWEGGEGVLFGDACAFLSAVFLGTYFLLVELLRDRFSATTILLWRCAVGSVLLAPVVWLSEGQFFPTTLTAWLGALGLGLVSEGLGQRLLADSMDRFSASFIAVFLLLEPAISALLALLIFFEQPSPLAWVGFPVILSGVYLAKSSGATASHAEQVSAAEAPEGEYQQASK